MIPSTVTMIPSYILLRELGWVDTYQAVILPAVFTAYGTFMLRQFFLTIPREIEDAARIDGCSPLGLYWRIALPLSRPAPPWPPWRLWLSSDPGEASCGH